MLADQQNYINQLCVATGCYLEGLPRSMVNRDWEQERVKGIRANKLK